MRDPVPDQPPLPGRWAFRPRIPSWKDGFLAVPYVLKMAGLSFLVPWLIDDVPYIGAGVVILILAHVGVIAILAFRGGRPLQNLRMAAFGMEVAVSAALFLQGGFHAARGERGDEVGIGYLILALPVLLLALPSLLPFDSEKESPEAPAPPGGDV